MDRQQLQMRSDVLPGDDPSQAAPPCETDDDNLFILYIEPHLGTKARLVKEQLRSPNALRVDYTADKYLWCLFDQRSKDHQNSCPRQARGK